MAKFRKKPVIIDAMQWSGHNKDEVNNFIGLFDDPNKSIHGFSKELDGLPIVLIQTLEGVHTTKPLDWIIKGVKGEFYPCKPDIFKMTYEPVE